MSDQKQEGAGWPSKKEGKILEKGGATTRRKTSEPLSVEL
jgi:hypothetical protein